MHKIKRLKRFGLLILGTLSFYGSFSQENYLSGYVINQDRDTLHGFIDYRNWGINPDEIKYKPDIDNNPVSFKPTDIIEFRIQDEIYVSGIVNTEVTPVKTRNLEKDPILRIKVDTAFLQTLIRGKKSLYYYKNSGGRENFYIQHDTAFELLIYKRYLKLYDDNLLATENKKYLGQLTLYLSDCPSILSKLENASYKQNSLINLFRYYYECSQSGTYYQKKEEKVSIEIGVLMGVSLSSLEFRSDAFAYLVNAGYNQSINFSTGLFFDIILTRNQGKWSVYNELLFTTYKVNGKYEDFKNENYYSITTTEIGYSYLKINNLVRFKYPIGRVFLYVNGGLSNGFAISETNYKRKESKLYSTEKIEEGMALDDTRKYEQGYILGIGVKYNKFSLDIRYEKGNGMSGYESLNSLTKRYYFLIGYKF